jgi:hypothetical protein
LLRPELDKSRGVEDIIMFGRVFGRSKPVPSTLSTLDKLNEVSSLVPPGFFSSLFKVTRISVLDSSDRNGTFVYPATCSSHFLFLIPFPILRS